MLEFSAASPLNEVISRKKRMISYVHQTLVVVACYQKIEIIINMGISLQRTRRPDKPQKCVTEIFPRASFPSKFFSIKNTSIRYNSIQFVINVRFLNMVLIIFHYWINFVDWYQLETRNKRYSTCVNLITILLGCPKSFFRFMRPNVFRFILFYLVPSRQTPRHFADLVSRLYEGALL